MASVRRVLVLLFMVALSSTPFAGGCERTETAMTGRIATTEGIHAAPNYGRDAKNDWEWLVVVLKPTENAKASTVYAAVLYEKGEFRDIAYVAWNQPELNVHETKDVKFPLTDTEMDAYFKVDDLRNIFSVKTVEKETVAPARLSRIYVEPDPAYPAPYDFYRIAVEVAPTDYTKAGQQYEVTLRYTVDDGLKESLSGEVAWTQGEIDSHTKASFCTTIGNKDSSEEFLDTVIKGSPELEVPPVE